VAEARHHQQANRDQEVCRAHHAQDSSSKKNRPPDGGRFIELM
jgi:hypothetical protein